VSWLGLLTALLDVFSLLIVFLASHFCPMGVSCHHFGEYSFMIDYTARLLRITVQGPDKRTASQPIIPATAAKSGAPASFPSAKTSLFSLDLSHSRLSTTKSELESRSILPRLHFYTTPPKMFTNTPTG
jgi:hypothetical protein